MTTSVDKLSNEAVFEDIKKIIISVFFDTKYYDHSLESIKTQIDNLNIEPKKKLIEDLHMDSLYLMDFVIALQEKYRFEMTKEQLAKMSTVGDAVELAVIESAKHR